MTRLNLGAGHRIIEDAINHDRVIHRPEIDIAHDLDVRPWPWDDSSIEEIIAYHVFEHLKLTLIETLDECWRIIASDGVLHIKFPIYTSETIHDDPTHRWYWSPRVLEYVDPTMHYGDIYGMYTDRKWSLDAQETIKNRTVVARLTPRGKH